MLGFYNVYRDNGQDNGNYSSESGVRGIEECHWADMEAEFVLRPALPVFG